MNKHNYIATFNTNNTVRIDELDVVLPDMPPLHTMENYGLPIEQQKFKREQLPSNFKTLRDGTFEKESIIDEMYQLRDNGKWCIIKGQPVYISGSAWFFFNCWTLQEGRLPDFHIEAVEFYQVLDWIVRTPHILGMLLVKGRQEGATAKINCWCYNMATRYKGAHIGLMGDDETRAKTNLAKITKGHATMIDFFKPISKGTTKTLSQLSFTIPEQKISIKNLDEIREKNYEGLESDITFKTGLGSYDGDRLLALYFDECFKTKAFDINKQLDILRPAFRSKRNLSKFSGKIIYASTVEEPKRAGEDESDVLKVTESMWEAANPKSVDKYGRTRNGLVRYFRSILESSPVDEWGFCKKDETLDIINEDIKTLIENKDWSGLTSFRRKNPLNIDDALQSSVDKCPLFPQQIELKLKELRDKVDQFGRHKEAEAVRGNLIFTDATWTSVRWMPDPTGRWLISQHPTEPNAKVLRNGKMFPKNNNKYRGFCDPTDVMDATSRDNQLSKTGIIVKRILDKSVEDLEKVGFYEKDGIELCRNPRALKTNRFICTYHHRNDDPDQNVVDALATAVYFGFQIAVETNSPSTHTNIMKIMPQYLANTPQVAKSETSKRSRKRATEKGWRTDQRNKSTATDCLISYFHDYLPIIEHEDLLRDAKKFNGSNHTKCDLAWCAMATEAQSVELSFKAQKEEQSEHWQTNVFV